MDLLNEYEAGAAATVLIVPRDAFGNNVSATGEDLSPYNFTTFALHPNGSFASVLNITRVGWNQMGFISIEFIAAKSGSFMLEVVGGNESLNGSPLLFKVNPGPGNYLLTISDSIHNRTLSNMPLAYTVFVAYTDASASIINGSGLNDSVAGKTSHFSIYLDDVFQYPSFVQLKSIQVRISSENDSYDLPPNIYPLINVCGRGQIGIAPAPSVSNNTIAYSRLLKSRLL